LEDIKIKSSPKVLHQRLLKQKTKAIDTMGKIGVVVQAFFAVCSRTAKIILPCAQIKRTAKILATGKIDTSAR
jgi:hypothetical protein